MSDPVTSEFAPLSQADALRLQRGVSVPGPAPRRIQVGELTVEVDGPDVRSVWWGSVELLQRIYMAVRDPAWNTVPGELTELEVTERPRSFEVRFNQRHTYGDIDLSWRGRITGDAAGVLVYEMDARPERDFAHAKIGLNLHHPLDTYVGRPYRARASGGTVTGELPETLAPQLLVDGMLTAMFDYFDAITFDLDGGLAVDFRFEGDWFEMQDHRNWSDGNFKTYGTPLSLGFPIDAHAGERIFQRVVMSVAGAAPAKRPLAEDVIELTEAVAGRLPVRGHSLTTMPDQGQLALLRDARPAHLRVEVRHDALDLTAAAGLAVDLGAGLELAVYLRADREQEDAERVAAEVGRYADVIARVIALTSSEGFSAFRVATPPPVVLGLRDELRSAGVQAPVFGGTDQFFNEVNRARPDYTGVDGVAFSLNPQVHAADDRSLAQNARVLPHIARTCRQLLPGLAIATSPVALVGLNGPFPAGPSQPGQLPSNLDVRQGALFGAVWTAAFLKSATLAQVDSVTLFDLVGSRGIVADDTPPASFPATSGRPLPLYHVLRAVAHAADPAVLSTSGTSAAVDALAVGSGLVLVFNLSNDPRSVQVGPLPGATARVRTLDETTVEQAATDPEGFVESAAMVPVQRSRLHLELRPYAVSFLEFPSTDGGR